MTIHPNLHLPTPRASSDREIEQLLSEPTREVVTAVEALEGDHMILGASGKMGITLAAMTRRALDQAGRAKTRVLGVARFRDSKARALLEAFGVEPITCDLREHDAVMALPEASNLQFLAGQKFGTAAAPEETWIENTVVPAIVARRFIRKRIVVFSTGCVYPLAPVDGSGSKETDRPGFVGEYAATCIGRERVFTYHAQRDHTPMLFFRLNYSVEFRYGVLVDIARAVWERRPVDVSTSVVNVIWQRDACARAIQCLLHVSQPPKKLNVSGGKIHVQRIAEMFGEEWGISPSFCGMVSPTAWHVDTAESQRLFGAPSASLRAMIADVARHVKAGGPLLEKPTHFAVRNGEF